MLPTITKNMHVEIFYDVPKTKKAIYRIVSVTPTHISYTTLAYTCRCSREFFESIFVRVVSES